MSARTSQKLSLRLLFNNFCLSLLENLFHLIKERYAEILKTHYKILCGYVLPYYLPFQTFSPFR